MDKLPDKFIKDVKARSRLRFVLGVLARIKIYLMIRQKLRIMRKKGAVVGSNIGIASGLRPPASPHLKIGDHVSIHTDRIDVRAPLTIGNYVILGDSASIITCSHNCDNPEWTFKSYGLVIEDYVWVATRAMILPSCRHIGRGAVIGAGAVVVKDVPSMSIVSGNPAKVIRCRKCVHSELLPETLLGGGLVSFIRARFCRIPG